jgi:WD40 repeat protein
MQVIDTREFAVDDDIDTVLNCEVSSIDWSPDSRYGKIFQSATPTTTTVIDIPSRLFLVAALMKAVARVELRARHRPEWRANIDAGALGAESAEWAPCGRRIVTSSSHRLRTVVWSLAARDARVQYAEQPALPLRSHRFSPAGGEFVAHLERRNGSDCLSLFACDGVWRLLAHHCLDTISAALVQWSPDGRRVAVADAPIACSVELYDPFAGKLVALYRSDVDSLHSIQWSPDSSIIFYLLCLLVEIEQQQLIFLLNYFYRLFSNWFG